jgi:hypothetical protein
MPPNAEASRFSYVRAIHEVKKSDQLDDFLRRVSGIGLEVLGYRSSSLIQMRPGNEDVLTEEPTTTLRGVGAGYVETYAASALRTTVFERRLPRSQRANSALSRLAARLMKVDFEGLGLPDSPLVSSPQYLIESSDPENKNIREFALVLEKDPTTEYFDAEAEFLKSSFAQKSRNPRYDIDIDPSVVPILTIPATVDGRKVENFTGQVDDMIMEEAMYGHGLEIAFDHIEINSKLR